MKFREKKINNSHTTRALFRVSIDSLEMDYKRWLILSSSPEAQGLLNELNLMVARKGDLENYTY